MEPVDKRVRHRFRRTVDGIVHYAEITLVLRDAPTPDRVSVYAAETMPVHASWRDAALRGVQEAATASGGLSRSVEIESIQGTMIDTRPDTVQVAAYRCAVELLTSQAAPEPKLIGGKWMIPPIQ